MFTPCGLLEIKLYLFPLISHRWVAQQQRFPLTQSCAGMWRPLQGSVCWVDFGRAPPYHSVYLQCRREEGLECSLAVTKHNLSCTRTRLLTKPHKH